MTTFNTQVIGDLFNPKDPKPKIDFKWGEVRSISGGYLNVQFAGYPSTMPCVDYTSDTARVGSVVGVLCKGTQWFAICTNTGIANGAVTLEKLSPELQANFAAIGESGTTPISSSAGFVQYTLGDGTFCKATFNFTEEYKTVPKVILQIRHNSPTGYGIVPLAATNVTTTSFGIQAEVPVDVSMWVDWFTIR